MNYQEFLNQAAWDLQKNLDRTYDDIRVGTQEVTKLQGESYVGIRLEQIGNPVSAVINPQHYFRDLMQGRPYSDIMDALRKDAADAIWGIPEFDVGVLGDYEAVKPKLMIQVVSREANREMLETVPHVEMEDMAQVFRISLDDHSGTGMSVLVTNDMLKEFGISKEQLAEDAKTFAPMWKPVEIMSMFEKLRELEGRTGGEEEIAGSADPMYVASTKGREPGGAGVIAYPDFMEQAAQKLGGDFFILPSSIHEVILLPDNGTFDWRELQEMVTEINATQVMPGEKLTDNVYHYDSKERVFETAKHFEERQAAKELDADRGRETKSPKKGSLLTKLDEKKNECKNRPEPVKDAGTKKREAAVL